MIEEYKNIELKIEELSTLLGFFRQKSIKKILYKDISKIEDSLEKVKNELENFQEEYKNYQDESNLTIKIKIEENELLENEKSRLSQEYNNLEKKYSEDISKIEDSLEKVKNELENLQEEYKDYEDIVLKNQLISKLLSSNSDNEGLYKYKEVLYKDFFDFANKEDSLANEAEAILKLQLIEKELELVTAYPNLYKKNIVAVGGGFSAGKSRFINSLLENSQIKLPEGVNPTTAIPTYVMHDERKQFIGCNNNGGIIDLYELDENFHSKLSHEFIKSFEFNLNKIMPFMIIGTSINKFSNLCFVDTPGYNPSDTDGGYTSEDKNISENFLENSETILWLIGLDSNGTISLSDINFLQKLDLENKSLYIVLNKADLKSTLDIEDIISEITEILNDYEINYIGISAYSSIQKEEISYSKISIFEFLKSIDTESEIQDKLIKKLYDVNYMYQEAIFKDIKEKEKVKYISSFLKNELFSKGFDNFSDSVYIELNKLERIHSSKAQEEDLQILEKVTLKLKDVIDEIFKKKSFYNARKIKKEDIKSDYDISIDNSFLEGND